MKTIILLLLIGAIAAEEMSVHVVGRFMCHEKPAQFAELKLVDYQPITGASDLNKDFFTDVSGHFDMTVSVNQWRKLRPWIYVWHKCHANPAENNDPCWRHIQIKVPEIQVQKGIFPTRTWNMGEFPLDLAQGQEEWCSG